MSIIQEAMNYKTPEDLKNFDWERNYTDTLHWLHNIRYVNVKSHASYDAVLLMVECASIEIKHLSIQQTIERQQHHTREVRDAM
jgi:hypothetical protein